MFLASKVANLFSSGSTNPQSNRPGFGFVDDGLSGVSGGKHTFADVKLGPKGFTPEIMASKTVEEEGRSPYLHVRYTARHKRSIANLIVYDSWRTWRHDRGYADALFGYCQDAPTR
jgi:hypothetical protein